MATNENEEPGGDQEGARLSAILNQVVRATGCRGGLLLLVSKDGQFLCAGAGTDPQVNFALQQMNEKMGPLVMEATCIVQDMMPCTKCKAQGRLPALMQGMAPVMCLACAGACYVPRPGIKQILSAPEGATP